jgi:hypothetical protein
VSQPQPKTYSITVFIVEGIKTAIQVTAIGSKLSQKNRRFLTPEAALAWCRANHAGLVYTPASNTAQN